MVLVAFPRQARQLYFVPVPVAEAFTYSPGNIKRGCSLLMVQWNLRCLKCFLSRGCIGMRAAKAGLTRAAWQGKRSIQ